MVADGAHLDGVPLAAAVALAGYLVAVQPVVGGLSQRRFERAVGRDPTARLRRYRRTTVAEWALVAVMVAIVAAAPDLSAGDVGVRWPGLGGGAAPYTVVGVLGLVPSVWLLVSLRRRVLREGVPLTGPQQVLRLLPRTVRERRAFLRLALTAGVCEEALYRGFLLACYVAWAGGASGWELVLVAAVSFGVAHLYQGGWGMLATGVLGGCLAILYVGTGSLLLPVLYHALIDIRALVLPAERPRHAR